MQINIKILNRATICLCWNYWNLRWIQSSNRRSFPGGCRNATIKFDARAALCAFSPQNERSTQRMFRWDPRPTTKKEIFCLILFFPSSLLVASENWTDSHIILSSSGEQIQNIALSRHRLNATGVYDRSNESRCSKLRTATSGVLQELTPIMVSTPEPFEIKWITFSQTFFFIYRLLS